jgi:hypothetical protein
MRVNKVVMALMSETKLAQYKFYVGEQKVGMIYVR